MLALGEVSRRLAGPAPPAVDPEVYSALRAVWRTYPRAAAEWRAVIPPDQITEERWAGLRNGVPLLDETALRWEAAPLRQQVRRLFRIFHSPSFSSLGDLAELPRLSTLQDSEPIEWARLFFRTDVGEPRPQLVIGGYVLQPFLYAFARHVMPRLEHLEWRRNRCPVCGGRPYHGYLDPQSRRKVLICGKCFCPWTAPRLQCPFCDNTLEEHLGFFYREHDPRQRIDYCTACRSILPITLDPESDRRFPLHDHLASLPFQVAVERSSHDHQPS